MNLRVGYREKLIVASACLVLLIVGWYILVYRTLQNKVVRVQEEIVQIRSDLASAENAKNVISRLQTEIDSLRQLLRSSQEKILRKDRLLYITQEIEAIADRHHMHVQQIILEKEALFSAASGEDFILPLPIHVYLVGNFFDFGRLLENLRNVPFLIKPKEVKIATDDDMYPDLGIEMVAYVYVYR